MAHTKQALARGYAAIAVDASDATRCFGWHADGEDVAAILQHWIKQNNFTVRQKTEAAEAGGGCTAGGRLGCSRGLRCRAPASL